MVELIDLQAELNAVILFNKILGCALVLPYGSAAQNARIVAVKATVYGQQAPPQPVVPPQPVTAWNNLCTAMAADPASYADVTSYDTAAVLKITQALASQIFIGHSWGANNANAANLEADALQLEANSRLAAETKNKDGSKPEAGEK